MIDLHCHLLPGMDDGAYDFAESIEMARSLAEHGFEAVIATPHVLDQAGSRHRVSDVEARVRELADALSREGIALKILPGAEYLFDRTVPETARYFHPLSTLAGSNYILIELPMLNWPNFFEAQAWPQAEDPPELKSLLPFLRTVVAHPERNQEVLRDYRRLHPLREKGFLFQVNLESVLGFSGKPTVKVIKKMAKEGLINFIGTDGHSGEGLKKLLPDWRRQVEKVLGKKLAELALMENPARIINNESIEW